MTQAFKYAATIALLLLCWPMTAYLAYWWARNRRRLRWERRFGIVHDPAELCRCGTWYCMHNEFLGSGQTGCMWFRRVA